MICLQNEFLLIELKTLSFAQLTFSQVLIACHKDPVSGHHTHNYMIAGVGVSLASDESPDCRPTLRPAPKWQGGKVKV